MTVARYENFTFLLDVISESQSRFSGLFRCKKNIYYQCNGCDFQWLPDMKILLN
jgi:hypothetical protein